MASTPTEQPVSVAIVGGGLGGVVLAIGLHQRHVPFHIYEAAQSFGEIGAGVAFGPNSVRALGLIAPDLLAAYQRHATSNETPALRETFMEIRRGTNEDGAHRDLLFSLRGSALALGRTGLPARCCVHRAAFLDEIVRLLPPGSTTFGKALVRLVDDADGQGAYQLHFADGSTAIASAVIGADGIRSPTRRHLHGPDARPVYAQEYVYRALVPRAAYDEALGPALAGNGQLYVGRGGYMVTYPVEGGASVNVVAARRCSEPWTHAAWQTPSTAADVGADFAAWDPALVGLLVRYGTRDKWALFDNLHADAYCRGRLCIVGDAAHATTPHLGAGAGMAMEDAYILSNLLGDCRALADVVRAFAAYDYTRRPRSQELVRASRQAGQTYALADEAVGSDVAAMEKALQNTYNWLWDADLAEHLAAARSCMATGGA